MAIYRDSFIYNDPTKNYRGGPIASPDLTSFRLHDENGNFIYEIPDIEDLQFKETKNEESGWSFSYPKSGSNFSQLISEKDRTFSARLPGGGYYWGYLEEDAFEEVDKQDPKANFSGRGTEGLLDYALVYPQASAQSDPDIFSGYSFTNKTVGFIMKTLFVWAKVRGAIGSIGINFNETKDSSGALWEVTNYTIDIPRGLTILQVLKQLSEKGWFDWRMTGHRLEIYNRRSATGMGIDRTGVIFRRGIHIQKVPRQRSRRDLATAVLVGGDNNQVIDKIDATAISLRGRKEVFVDSGGINSIGMLDAIATTTLDDQKVIRLSKTASVAYGDLRPMTDFRAGDFVYVDINDGAVEKLRIIEYSYSFPSTSNGKAVGEIAFNDRFLEYDVVLASKIDKLRYPGATGVPTTSAPAVDLGIPIAPGSLGIVTDVYLNNSHRQEASVIISWAHVTTNTNGTIAADILDYLPEWKYSTSNIWNILPAVVDNYSFVNGLAVNKSVDVRVRARDQNRHISAYSTLLNQVTAQDITPPPLPSTHVVTTRAGQTIVTWNGLAQGNISMPSDFDHINVYYSQIFQADIANSTLAGDMRGAGSLVVSSLAYSQKYYFRLTAVDVDGNESDLNDPVEITVVAILGGDITANNIVGGHILAGQIDTTKLKAINIEAEKVSFGATSNMIPDPSFGDSDARATRLTLAEQPTRWQWSNFGGGVLTPSSGYYLEALGNATDRTSGFIELSGWFGVHAHEKYYLKSWVRRWNGNDGSQFYLALRVLRTDGTIVHRGGAGALPDLDWHRYWLTAEIQPGDVEAKFVVTTLEHTNGSIFFDEVEVRNFTNNAVENGSSSRIEIAPTGIYAESSTGDRTFELDAEFGDVYMRGTLVSGVRGKRIEVNPGSTYVPEIRFYPSLNESLFGYINSVDVGGGQIPVIGINAPDTGATGMALVLYDTGFQLGEINKLAGAIAGPGILSEGAGHSAYLYSFGRMPALNLANQMIGSYRFNMGAPTAGTSTAHAVILAKPPTPSSGQWLLVYSIQRNSAVKFTNQITGITGTTATVALYPATTWDAVVSYINHIWIRSDGDV